MKFLLLFLLLGLVLPLDAQSFKNIPLTVTQFPEASTALQERDMAISPDGSLMFYTLQGNQHAYSVIVYRIRNKDLTWSAPVVAPFSGQYADLEPAFTSDGKKLFFSSNRPLINGPGTKDYDIWYVERLKEGWTQPVNVGPAVNTTNNEFYPSVATSGNLYFTAEYEHGVGKEDVFVSEFRDNKFQSAVALDTAVNSKFWEFNAFVSPDEKMIIFTSYGRKGDMGGGDLYLAFKNDEGKWQPAKQVSLLNSKWLDYCPFVSFDQKALFFTSGRHDIPKAFAKATTYQELMKLQNSGGNASENVYWISLDAVLTSLH